MKKIISSYFGCKVLINRGQDKVIMKGGRIEKSSLLRVAEPGIEPEFRP